MPESTDDVLARVLQEEQQLAAKVDIKRSRYAGLDRTVWRVLIAISVVLGLVRAMAAIWAASAKQGTPGPSGLAFALDFMGMSLSSLVLLCIPFYLGSGLRSLGRYIRSRNAG